MQGFSPLDSPYSQHKHAHLKRYSHENPACSGLTSSHAVSECFSLLSRSQACLKRCIDHSPACPYCRGNLEEYQAWSHMTGNLSEFGLDSWDAHNMPQTQRWLLWQAFFCLCPKNQRFAYMVLLSARVKLARPCLEIYITSVDFWKALEMPVTHGQWFYQWRRPLMPKLQILCTIVLVSVRVKHGCVCLGIWLILLEMSRRSVDAPGRNATTFCIASFDLAKALKPLHTWRCSVFVSCVVAHALRFTRFCLGISIRFTMLRVQRNTRWSQDENLTIWFWLGNLRSRSAAKPMASTNYKVQGLQSFKVCVVVHWR